MILPQIFKTLSHQTLKATGIKSLSLFLILTGLFTACAATKTSQCQKIIVITQKMAKKSEKYRNSQDIAQVLEVADYFEDAAAEMRDLSLPDKNLEIYQQGFAEVYSSHAQTTRQFIEALQNKDIARLRLLQRQVQQIGQKEQKLGEDMNNYCNLSKTY